MVGGREFGIKKKKGIPLKVEKQTKHRVVCIPEEVSHRWILPKFRVKCGFLGLRKRGGVQKEGRQQDFS
jgi:hypothetical protein